MTPAPAPLAAFLRDFGAVDAAATSETERLQEGARLLARLVADDAWLPDAYAAPDPARYTQ